MGIKQKVIKTITVLANQAVSETRIKQLQNPCYTSYAARVLIFLFPN